MGGPLLFQTNTITKNVKNGLPGCFLLCDFDMVVRYVGRSDTDIQAELLRYVGSKEALWFYYEYSIGPKQAFDLECAYYHRHYQTTMNKIHPRKPDGTNYQCPVNCGYDKE